MLFPSEASTYYCPRLAYLSDLDNKKVYFFKAGDLTMRLHMSMRESDRPMPESDVFGLCGGAECRAASVEYRVQSVECKVTSAQCRMTCAE